MKKSATTVCVGIDTGGTFTDLVAVELERGRFHYHKVPTVTDDPARGILEGIAELLDQNGLARADVSFLVLGTTLATNAVLLLRISTPAGAGYGECSQRDPAAIERDVREERISADAAHSDYGYRGTS